LHPTSKKYKFYIKSFEIVANTRHKTEKPLPMELKQVKKYAIPDETCVYYWQTTIPKEYKLGPLTHSVIND